MLSWIKYPGDNVGASGEQVNYTYLPQGALKQVSNPTYTYAKEMKYDAAGRLTSITRGNSTLVTAHSYYSWDETVVIDSEAVGQGGRLKQTTTGTLQNLSYRYDANGNIDRIVDAIASETSIYDYDALNRLTSVDGPGYDESYAYDSATGNMSSKTDMGNYTYSTTHKHAAISTSEGWSYEYDSNGNMTRREDPDDNYYVYSYDAENRLISVNTTPGTSFKYDGDGNRVQAILNNVTTAYIGNYYEWTGTAGTMVKYYYAGSQRVAMRTGTAAPKWILSDHLGSTSVVTAFDGTTPVYQRYKPFGETRLESPLGTKYTFTGQLSHTDDFGLLFFNARWVDPQLARFAQADSIVPNAYNPQDYDRYAYTRNNPLRYVDPSGHICLESTGGEICSADTDSNGWWYPGDVTPDGIVIIACPYGNGLCQKVPVGEWHITNYVYATESDARWFASHGFTTNPDVTMPFCDYYDNCITLTVPWRFLYGAEGVLMQGTGRIVQGNQVYYIHQGKSSGAWKQIYYQGSMKPDYFDGWATFELGLGGPGYEMTPEAYAAVGSSYKGGYFYIPDLAGTANGGFFAGLDTGGGIENGDLDVFVGIGLGTSDDFRALYFNGRANREMFVYQVYPLWPY